VLEALGGIKLLLTDGENKIQTAVTARQGPIAEAHGKDLLSFYFGFRVFAGSPAQPATQTSRGGL
jgi:hypothetical protein